MKVGTGRSTCNVGVDAKADDQTTLAVKIIRLIPDSDQRGSAGWVGSGPSTFNLDEGVAAIHAPTGMGRKRTGCNGAEGPEGGPSPVSSRLRTKRGIIAVIDERYGAQIELGSELWVSPWMGKNGVQRHITTGSRRPASASITGEIRQRGWPGPTHVCRSADRQMDRLTSRAGTGAPSKTRTALPPWRCGHAPSG
jgi:hypothetical protein